jgi:hypothetical protein
MLVDKTVKEEISSLIFGRTGSIEKLEISVIQNSIT